MSRPSATLVSSPLLTASSEYFTPSGAFAMIFFSRASARSIRWRPAPLRSPGQCDRLQRIDDFAGENELECSAFSDQTRETLRASIARHDSDLYFWLTEFRALGSDSDRAWPSPARIHHRGQSR